MLLALDAREARLEQKYISALRSTSYADESERAMMIAMLNRESNQIAIERRALDDEF